VELDSAGGRLPQVMERGAASAVDRRTVRRPEHISRVEHHLQVKLTETWQELFILRVATAAVGTLRVKVGRIHLCRVADPVSRAPGIPGLFHSRIPGNENG